MLKASTKASEEDTVDKTEEDVVDEVMLFAFWK
jgi:hypothetical protein